MCSIDKFDLTSCKRSPISQVSSRWQYMRKAVPFPPSVAWADRNMPPASTLTTPTTAATQTFVMEPDPLVPSAGEEWCSACCLCSPSSLPETRKWHSKDHQETNIQKSGLHSYYRNINISKAPIVWQVVMCDVNKSQ